jgi:hypothetical protein
LLFEEGNDLSLESRKKAFGELASRFECERPAPLLAVHKIPPALFCKLQTVTALYLSKCLGSNEFILDENELLSRFDELGDKVQNITPNGMVVPKRNTILEYNLLVQTFSEIIGTLGIHDLISSWHVPLNVRIKYGEACEENLKRHHPTEHIHSDSWAGESSESVTTMFMILGDIPKNHVTFYDPPDSFQEEWLGPRPTYQDGKVVADRYSKIDLVPEKGDLLISDFASLHASSRLPGAKTRVTIDTTFVLKKTDDHRVAENIHEWREGERAAPHILEKVGEESILYFPDRPDQHVDSQGGFKHPTNLTVVSLPESSPL